MMLHTRMMMASHDKMMTVEPIKILAVQQKFKSNCIKFEYYVCMCHMIIYTNNNIIIRIHIIYVHIIFMQLNL